MTTARMLLELSIVVAVVAPAAGQEAGSQSILARRAHAGEVISYRMRATNQNRDHVLRYQADAIGRVTRDSSGHWVDSLEWSHFVQDGDAVPLAAGTRAVEQRLEFAPGFLIPPDIAHADPRLTGPVLDLFTFYVDWWLAARSPALRQVGDTVRVPGRASNSWADGQTVLLGSDAVDFVITLTAIDSAARLAHVLIRHVAPDSARVPLPAAWMRPPIALSPNNWVQIEALGGRFTAGVGHEEFDVRLTVDLTDGRIMRASMDNPVDVLERVCSDRGLVVCEAPVRYRIVRTISLERLTRQ